jgi:hypothetical protein
LKYEYSAANSLFLKIKKSSENDVLILKSSKIVTIVNNILCLRFFTFIF